MLAAIDQMGRLHPQNLHQGLQPRRIGAAVVPHPQARPLLGPQGLQGQPKAGQLLQQPVVVNLG